MIVQLLCTTMFDDLTIDADWNHLYIDGEWWSDTSLETINVEDPSTREQVAAVPAATEAEIDAAYEAAAEAQSSWASQPPARRETVVDTVESLLQEYSEEIVELLATEGGGTRVMAETSVHLAADQAAEASTLPRRMKGELRESNIPGKEHLVRKVPKGVVTVISPWNFPLNLSMRAVAPAIAAGNAVVLKPSSESPLVGGLVLAALFEEAGLPNGVLNVVTGKGSDIGDVLAGHPISDAVAFTGSTDVGRRVAAKAGENLAMQAMELGGNNPHIVTADADIGQAIDAAVFGSFVHQGQVCISINRHLVHESVYQEYVDRLTDRAEALAAGSAHDPSVVVGPIINESQRDAMLSYIDESDEAGATVETGGKVVDVDGVRDSLVVAPTVLSDVDNEMPIAANEHFGPIAPVIPFTSIEEAVTIANDTEFGLASSVHAGDLDTAWNIADQLDTGHVHINDQPVNDEAHVPFSGTNASGMGGYNSELILDAVTETKWISVQRESRDYPL